MGIRLMVEVLDHAPEELTPAERLVLLALAEKANDETRAVWASKDLRPTLMRRTGLTDRGLKSVLSRLATRGLEVRVPIGQYDDGRPLFACRGRSTGYRLPVLNGDLLGNPIDPSDGGLGTSQGTQSDATAHPIDPNGCAVASPYPSDVPQNPSDAREEQIKAGAAQVALLLDVDPDEAESIATRIWDEGSQRAEPIKHLGRYLATWKARDLERYKPQGTGAEKCPHDKAGGRRVVGHGDQASRVCGKCEAADPAAREAVA